MTTLEDIVWSVQPKRSPEDRRHLVALLPSLLKRLSAGMHNRGWAADDRETFMANLVEAHAAAVKPSLPQAASPTAAVAEAARAQAEIAKASGDDVLAAKAEALAAAMTQAEPEPVEPAREIVDDDYLEIARSLERGMWIEFEARRWPSRVRQARMGEPAARHLPLHEPAGAEGVVDDGRGPGGSFPRRPRAAWSKPSRSSIARSPA